MRLARKLAVRLALGIALAIVVLLLRSTVFDWYRVTGSSMVPTLHSGNLIGCNRLAYALHIPGFRQPLWQWATPEVGDVVVFRAPQGGRRCVKRVARAPEGARPLPPGQFWVLGDNAAHSTDSRAFGPVPLDLICGRVVLPSLPATVADPAY